MANMSTYVLCSMQHHKALLSPVTAAATAASRRTCAASLGLLAHLRALPAVQVLYRLIQNDLAGFQPVLGSLVQQSQLLQNRTRSGQQLFEEQLTLIVQQCLADAPPEDTTYSMLVLNALQSKSVIDISAADVLAMVKRAAAIEQAAQSCQPSRTATALLQALTQAFLVNRAQLARSAQQADAARTG
jgi:hypothetical protein